MKCFTKMINLLSHWLDSFQTCTNIPFGQPWRRISFGDLDPIIKVKSQLTNGIFLSKNEIFHKPMDGYLSNLHVYIIITYIS